MRFTCTRCLHTHKPSIQVTHVCWARQNAFARTSEKANLRTTLTRLLPKGLEKDAHTTRVDFFFLSVFEGEWNEWCEVLWCVEERAAQSGKRKKKHPPNFFSSPWRGLLPPTHGHAEGKILAGHTHVALLEGNPRVRSFDVVIEEMKNS